MGAGSTGVPGGGHGASTRRGDPRRLGWTLERSGCNLPRQIKGERGGLPLMF